MSWASCTVVLRRANPTSCQHMPSREMVENNCGSGDVYQDAKDHGSVIMIGSSKIAHDVDYYSPSRCVAGVDAKGFPNL